MKVMLFNCKLTLTSNDTIKLDNTVTERNLLYIISLPQTAERVNRDGCSAPVCVMSLAQTCGTDITAQLQQSTLMQKLHKKTVAVRTLLIFYDMQHMQAGLRFEVNVEHGSV